MSDFLKIAHGQYVSLKLSKLILLLSLSFLLTSCRFDPISLNITKDNPGLTSTLVTTSTMTPMAFGDYASSISKDPPETSTTEPGRSPDPPITTEENVAFGDWNAHVEIPSGGSHVTSVTTTTVPNSEPTRSTLLHEAQ
jgi:hypothetical protein